MAGEGGSYLAGGGVPKAYLPVFADRREGAAVGAECHVEYSAGSWQCDLKAASGDIPQAECLVITSRKGGAVGTEHDP
ncbi:hypothetical protein GCM10022245_20550 [Streptomyces mayteni]